MHCGMLRCAKCTCSAPFKSAKSSEFEVHIWRALQLLVNLDSFRSLLWCTCPSNTHFEGCGPWIGTQSPSPFVWVWLLFLFIGLISVACILSSSDSQFQICYFFLINMFQILFYFVIYPWGNIWLSLTYWLRLIDFCFEQQESSVFWPAAATVKFS